MNAPGARSRPRRVARAALALLAAAALTSGCAVDPPAPSTSGQSSTSGDGSPSGAPQTSAGQGATVVAVGEPVTVHVGEADGARLTMVVTDVDVVDSCPGRAAPVQEPERGWFVVVDLTVTGDVLDQSERVGPEHFSVESEDGEREALPATAAAWACFEDDELLPPFVEPGETVSGRIVLDSAVSRGWVIFAPFGEEKWRVPIALP